MGLESWCLEGVTGVETMRLQKFGKEDRVLGFFYI